MAPRAFRFVLLSLLILIPCFWLPRIYTVDLPSHAYNAWLALLAEKGQAPGIYIAPVWHNFAFDVLLTETMRAFGPDIAQRVSVSLCVLMFFWGALAWLRSRGRCDTLAALPLLVMATYGWVFQAGFFNFYLGIGLGLFACALDARRILLTMPLLAAAWICHPIAGACVTALMLVQLALDRLPDRRRLWFVALSAALIVVAGIAGRLLLHIVPRDGGILLFGADQLNHSGFLSRIAELALIALGLWFLGSLAANATPGELLHNRPLQLLVLASLAALALPWGVKLARYEIPITLIRDRASILLLLCFALLWLASEPPPWARAAMAALCVLSLVSMYGEARRAHQIEERLLTTVEALPPATRVVTRVTDLGARTPLTLHLAERACIGRCFVINNYEPATGHFRIRVRPDSYIAIADRGRLEALDDPGYRLREEDLPLVILHSSPNRCDDIIATEGRPDDPVPGLIGVSWGARMLFPVLPEGFRRMFEREAPCSL